jgi:hypothetical protein
MNQPNPERTYLHQVIAYALRAVIARHEDQPLPSGLTQQLI